MPDHTSAYRTSAEQLVELIEQVPDEKLTIMVPACPEWSVKGLIAHFAGVAGDVATGNLTAVGSEEWTSAQITARKETPVGEILEEFRTQAAQLAGAIERRTRNSPPSSSSGPRQVARGQGEPQATVTASDFELLRALTGRRTDDEIRALEWDGDPETFLRHFSMYGHPPRSLGEQGQS